MGKGRSGGVTFGGPLFEEHKNRGRSRQHLSVILLVVVFLINSEPVSSLRDDWYGFVSFESTTQWADPYEFTCSYGFDLFREPRSFTRRDRLRGRREAHSPVRFLSKEAKPALENVTLHIYNNKGIRKGHSVSYGFQRNKECLHGQDADCVVFPETGRVRAVVLNAERFTEKQNLNYFKDNFLIERPERYVTILNGGSTFERKFYEAVFLGGYPNKTTRSSHEIDGETYPLEIYMYFLDETVPSVTLSTILVVLVEESDRDNPHIKPVTNAIEQNLYDAERRFLDKNKAMIRRERLFHHLVGSTSYDVYNIRNQNSETIFQEALASSYEHEATFTRYVEVFEKMQALEAETFFIQEDKHRVEEAFQENSKFIRDVNDRRGNNELFPTNHTEMHLLSTLSIIRGYISARSERMALARDGIETCQSTAENYVRNVTNFFGVYPKVKKITKLPTGTHLDDFVNLVVKVCEYFDEHFTDPFNLNAKNETKMLHLTVEEKYQLIEDLKNSRKARDEVNELVRKHFDDPTFHPKTPQNLDDEVLDFADEMQKSHVVDGFQELILRRAKRVNYQAVKKETQNQINKIVERLGYKDEEDMHDVMQYLKFGSKQNDLKYFRASVHEEYVNRQLPVQEKKRSLVELGGMGMSEEEIRAYEQTDPVKATVNEAFQISWLMPADGGYYYYQGGSPIPPCFRAQNMVLFKRPIKMSRRQIDLLTRVPTSFDRSEDIHYTTPRIHDTKFTVELTGSDTFKSRKEEVDVPIYDQKRNHLFLGHDGVHKNAVEEWDKIRDRKNGTGAIKDTGRNGVVAVLMLIVIYAARLF